MTTDSGGDGGTADGGSGDGGSGDGGSGDGGSGDGGTGDSGGTDTGGPTYMLPDQWGTLLDGPSCSLGAYASVRSLDDTMAIKVDMTELLKEACASKTGEASTAIPAEAFKLLRGSKLSLNVCGRADGVADESVIAQEIPLSVGRFEVQIVSESKWCADADSTLVMGKVTGQWVKVLGTTGGTTQEMGTLAVGPFFMVSGEPEAK